MFAIYKGRRSEMASKEIQEKLFKIIRKFENIMFYWQLEQFFNCKSNIRAFEQKGLHISHGNGMQTILSSLAKTRGNQTIILLKEFKSILLKSVEL